MLPGLGNILLVDWKRVRLQYWKVVGFKQIGVIREGIRNQIFDLSYSQNQIYKIGIPFGYRILENESVSKETGIRKSSG